mmetsp:Transcript_70029/g.227153  ORF Transcript_70029/g.227153 Transcript_70029/m.227153 type:complete len:224 (+) Transcript_70029:847-1518(+)
MFLVRSSNWAKLRSSSRRCLSKVLEKRFSDWRVFSSDCFVVETDLTTSKCRSLSPSKRLRSSASLSLMLRCATFVSDKRACVLRALLSSSSWERIRSPKVADVDLWPMSMWFASARVASCSPCRVACLSPCSTNWAEFCLMSSFALLRSWLSLPIWPVCWSSLIPAASALSCNSLMSRSWASDFSSNSITLAAIGPKMLTIAFWIKEDIEVVPSPDWTESWKT